MIRDVLIISAVLGVVLMVAATGVRFKRLIAVDVHAELSAREAQLTFKAQFQE